MDLSLSRSLLALSLALLSVTPALAQFSQSQQEYQFALHTFYKDIDIEQGAEGSSWGLAATAYLEPVKLSEPYPNAITAFYQGTPGAQFGWISRQTRDLNQVRSGRVAQKADNQNLHASLFGTLPSTPVWLGVDLIKYGDTRYRFNSGPDAKSSHEPYKAFRVGSFINRDHSLHIEYINADLDGLGAGYRSFFEMGARGTGMELAASMNALEREVTHQEYVNNVLRSESTSTFTYRTWSLGATAYPIKSFGIPFSYGRSKDSEGERSKFFSIGLTLDTTQYLSLGIAFQRQAFQHPLGRSLSLDEESIGLSAGLRL